LNAKGVQREGMEIENNFSLFLLVFKMLGTSGKINMEKIKKKCVERRRVELKLKT
jgi:hypothetical protein